MAVETLREQRCFGGVQGSYAHQAVSTGCRMRFSLYRPPQAQQGPVPVVMFLSGLTCTDENFTIKAGAQRAAAELGLALLVPDTSPRGLGLPHEDDAIDLGTGAGFYVNATEEPWSRGYRMHEYVVHELPALAGATFGVDVGRLGVSGHSMGGHGALVCALRNPGRFRSVSAFSPISSASRSPWARKAFTAYLGSDEARWREWDAEALIRDRGLPAGSGASILVDQGTADEFIDRELKPDLLEAACRDRGVPLTLRRQEGYDHSYFFIATFIADHLRHHAAALGG